MDTDSNTNFLNISIAESCLKDSLSPSSLPKALNILNDIMSKDLDNSQKTMVTSIFNKLMEIFKTCDNRVRFIINVFFSQYSKKFSQILVRRDVINGLCGMLNNSNYLSRLYTLQLLINLPFLLDNRFDLIHAVIFLI